MATFFKIFAGFSSGSDSTQVDARFNRAIFFECLYQFHRAEGFTVLEGTGCYQDTEEQSAVAIFVAKESHEIKELRKRVILTAECYKERGYQKEVWVTESTENLFIV